MKELLRVIVEVLEINNSRKVAGGIYKQVCTLCGSYDAMHNPQCQIEEMKELLENADS